MTGVTLIMKLISLFFNVYITAKIGASGIGLYSLIMSVGSFAITFATSGVNLASTRLTAEALGRGSNKDVRRAMKSCIMYGFVFGITGTILLFVLAKPLSVYALNDVRCITPLKSLSFCLPFISLSSALTGYFTAVRRVVKNAVVQIFQQFMNITVTTQLIRLLLPKGIEYACTALIIGSLFSEGMAFLLSFITYIFDIKKYNDNSGNCESGQKKKLISIAMPVAVSAYVRSGLVSVEHILIPRGLRKYGAGSNVALASYGTLHGMVMPVVLFPMAIISSFASLIVPEIAGSIAAGEIKRVENMISRAIQITLAFSVGCAGILICFSQKLGHLIYSSTEAGVLINNLAPLIPVMYFDHITDGILKGMGEQVYSMRVNVFDSLMSVILVYIMIPKMGIYGYIVIIYAMEIMNTALGVIKLLQISDVKIDILGWVVKPLICIFGATTLQKMVLSARIFDFLPDSVIDISGIVLSVVFYIIFIRITSCFDKNDMKWLRKALE